jgi:rare lipoprotein A
MNKLKYIFLIFLLIISSCAPSNKNFSFKKSPFSGGEYKIGKPYQIEGKTFYPKESFDYLEGGVASWYGPNFDGKKTANGEIFNMNLLTAAHKTLQLPSLVKVTNIENNRSLILRVNDRGPFVKNRIIDVSKKAASILGFQKNGTANVIVEYYGRAKIYDKEGKIIKLKKKVSKEKDKRSFYIRIGLFSEINNVEKIKSQLKNFGNIEINKNQSGYKVLLGPFANKNYTERVLSNLKEKGFKDAIIENIN